jgi:hypothetical protein
MVRFSRRRTWHLLAGVLVAALAVAGLLAGGPSQATPISHGTPTAVKAVAAKQVVPDKANMLDCNGWSKKYATVNSDLGGLCTDPVKAVNGKDSRFIDNGWYVGHDEPSVKFISYAPGSGNNMTYYMTVPKDPTTAPTANGSVTDYGELSVAPWFGLAMCDPDSYPQNPCTPDSDANIGTQTPMAAGDAFMELQFYPPGFTPFVDSESCSATQWCAALTIDSLECSYNFLVCNQDCEEPVNFSFLQTNGVPPGPPSPQLADVSTFLPNAKTLMINQGDTVGVSITDPPSGFTATVTDYTTGETGYMTASAANGFMNTNIKNCDGTPYTFHAEYNTAAPQNMVPWAALEGGVLMEEEIGHAEVCNSLAHKDGYSVVDADGQSFTDPDVYQTCLGGSEGPKAVGEGPCTTNKKGVISCKNATTQGPMGVTKCATNNPATGALCEFSDGYCFPKGSRPVVVNGVPTTEAAPVDFCFADQYQNGDLDFDGLSYQASAWPNGTSNTPTPMVIAGPYTDWSHTYPYVQFESDIGGSSNLCNVTTGADCLVPPIDADFYPFYTLSEYGSGGQCDWNFGTVIPGVTTSALGGDGQYGAPDTARYGGTSISPVQVNPETAYVCEGTSLRVRPAGDTLKPGI